MNKRFKQISLVATIILVMFLNACNSNTKNSTFGGNTSPYATQAPINSPSTTATPQEPTDPTVAPTQPVVQKLV